MQTIFQRPLITALPPAAHPSPRPLPRPCDRHLFSPLFRHIRSVCCPLVVRLMSACCPLLKRTTSGQQTELVGWGCWQSATSELRFCVRFSEWNNVLCNKQLTRNEVQSVDGWSFFRRCCNIWVGWNDYYLLVSSKRRLSRCGFLPPGKRNRSCYDKNSLYICRCILMKSI